MEAVLFVQKSATFAQASFWVVSDSCIFLL